MTKAKDDLFEKIEARMDKLETQLKAQEHISDPASVHDTIRDLTKFWSVLDDENKDYIHFAQDALREQRKW